MVDARKHKLEPNAIYKQIDKYIKKFDKMVISPPFPYISPYRGHLTGPQANKAWKKCQNKKSFDNFRKTFQKRDTKSYIKKKMAKNLMFINCLTGLKQYTKSSNYLS